ncbi:MAG: PQQ-dependent sugar dehydrogenase [Verrucomicrobia bacterium]|nr:PQQ-dependent sugar dehydrogenase [Verrucomicrobiota bacterium]
MDKSFSLLGGLLALLLAATAWSQPFGLPARVANTTLKMPAQPPQFGYRTERAFGNLNFIDPVAIVTPPGESNRVFVVEQAGRILVVPDLANPTSTVFLDLTDRTVPGGERGLLGLAFHPGYKMNGYFYVFYTRTATTAAGTGLHDRLARFTVSPDDPNRALPESETPLFTQRDEAENHNGGDLQFGLDGYLYVALGDEGGGNDQYNNSQRIDKDFFAGLLRIDVDKRPGGLAPNPHAAAPANYAVPPDNPFVGATTFNGKAVDPAKVRTEFWAVGLRNPWRFCFDRATGLLYCADVGQDAREEIVLIVKGGNYGWNYREATIAGPRTPPAGFTSLPPLLDYEHIVTGGNNRFRGNCVIGGVVYRGARLSQLFGAYVFADYASGNIWALRHEGATVVSWLRLASDTGISGFGTDPRNGDVLFADLNDDTIKRLVYDATPIGTALPPTLADTGAFADLKTLTPQPGIVPYELNVPFWSDGAHKTRWFSVPDVKQKIGFSPNANWSFPTGTVWIKHFELELATGVPASRRRLETRFLLRNANGVYGVTYRWNDEQSNATLVGEEGLDESFSIDDHGVARTQVWHYPSRAECLTCHTTAGGLGLGFNTAQLNRDFDYSGVRVNQLRALSHAEYFSNAVVEPHTLRALAPAADTAVSVEWRVRSFLAANCAQCHQPGGPAPTFWDARATTPLALAGLLNGRLWQADDAEDAVIKPGSLEDSELYERIADLGPRHMPPLATSVLNTEAINLLATWITTELPNYKSYAEWRVAHFGSETDPAGAPEADPDDDGANNQLEYLTGTNPRQAGDGYEVSIQRNGDTAEIIFPRVADRGSEVLFTESLTDPASWRVLDVPSNRPFFPATPGTGTVTDTLGGSASRFYRVRVYEP